MKISSNRQNEFRRNDILESLLTQLNTSLDVIEPPVPDEPLSPLFILGAPRSGTTYFLQCLATSGAFSYPSNFIARFWTSPFIGALAQEMVTNTHFDFRGEFSDIVPSGIERKSDLGKTKGFLSPNEFWYFWRHFFASDGDIGVSLEKSNPSNFRNFGSELAAFSSVLNRPVAMKAMIVNHEIEILAEQLPEALFVVVDRNPLENAWSILKARERMHGDIKSWYSFKTPDKESLKAMTPHYQVAGQVGRVRADLQASLSKIDPLRYFVLSYETLCESPEIAFMLLEELYEAKGQRLSQPALPAPSPVSHPAIPEPDRSILLQALGQERTAFEMTDRRR